MQNAVSCVRLGLLLILPFVIQHGGWSQSPDYIYLVRASMTTTGENEHDLTGFRLKGQPGIITALHGVVGCKSITVTLPGEKSLTFDVSMTAVDIPDDLALLSSSEVESNTVGFRSRIITTPEWQSVGPLKVIGYPMGVSTCDLTTPLTGAECKPLSAFLDDTSLLALHNRDSPAIDRKVIRLIGGLIPGDSGAPILDQDNNVVAVGNVGRTNSDATITWGIPIGSMSLVSPDDNWQVSKALAKLAKLPPSSIFSYPDDPPKAAVLVPKPPGLSPRFSRVVMPVHLENDVEWRILSVETTDSYTKVTIEFQNTNTTRDTTFHWFDHSPLTLLANGRPYEMLTDSLKLPDRTIEANDGNNYDCVLVGGQRVTADVYFEALDPGVTDGIIKYSYNSHDDVTAIHFSLLNDFQTDQK